MVLTDLAMHEFEKEILMLDLIGDSPKKKKKREQKGKYKKEDPDSKEERKVKKKSKKAKKEELKKAIMESLANNGRWEEALKTRVAGASSRTPPTTIMPKSPNREKPFSESLCVTTMMDLMDPFGNSKKSMEKMVEVNQGSETSSILVLGSSSKSDNSICKGFEFVSLNDSSIATMDSMDPLENFKIVENNHNIFNSQRFYNNVDDEIVENVIEDLKKEKERFFYEGGEKTSSILEVSSSKNNSDRNTFEFQPFSESSCVTTRMNLKDPFGNSKKSKGKMVEVNQGIEISSIREVGSTSKSDHSSSKGFEFVPLNGSSIVLMDSVNPLGNSKKSMKEVVESSSKSDYNGSNGIEYLPFNDSSIIALMNSVNPYEDFKKSMKEMLEANQQTTECEKCLEELLIWYLKSNGKANHRYIIDAFFDLVNGYTSSINTTSCSHSFINSPFFGSTPSVSASSPFLSLLEAEDEIVNEITTTRRFSL
ncbi:hypothetical protein CQW23_24579 [Capsicum baccatum]|uniref:Transcription repressor n=1 Tax=Capsicum baccatum TaxID=33114 RepID=A0A2G2VV55_CAPBA|nr:hypothetical protein CQW23_24579 [Capsicum baccatum]